MRHEVQSSNLAPVSQQQDAGAAQIYQHSEVFTMSFQDPTPEMLITPEFEAVWQCIKKWDINVPDAYAGYCGGVAEGAVGAPGNHVRAILDSLQPFTQRLSKSEAALQNCNECSKALAARIAELEAEKLSLAAQVEELQTNYASAVRTIDEEQALAVQWQQKAEELQKDKEQRNEHLKSARALVVKWMTENSINCKALVLHAIDAAMSAEEHK